MLQDSFERLRKIQKVEHTDVKLFMSHSDLNHDGKIDKKEFATIIEKSVKVR